jgi:hypothetical protein
VKFDHIDDLLPWTDKFAAAFHSDEVELDIYPLCD